uniref:Uncharacterized protein n=1 Tax=Romanomermis culicivorax TaxID=13658 RepID=A0A915K828_ROMCU
MEQCSIHSSQPTAASVDHAKHFVVRWTTNLVVNHRKKGSKDGDRGQNKKIFLCISDRTNEFYQEPENGALKFGLGRCSNFHLIVKI